MHIGLRNICHQNHHPFQPNDIVYLLYVKQLLHTSCFVVFRKLRGAIPLPNNLCRLRARPSPPTHDVSRNWSPPGERICRAKTPAILGPFSRSLGNIGDSSPGVTLNGDWKLVAIWGTIRQDYNDRSVRELAMNSAKTSVLASQLVGLCLCIRAHAWA